MREAPARGEAIELLSADFSERLLQEFMPRGLELLASPWKAAILIGMRSRALVNCLVAVLTASSVFGQASSSALVPTPAKPSGRLTMSNVEVVFVSVSGPTPELREVTPRLPGLGATSGIRFRDGLARQLAHLARAAPGRPLYVFLVDAPARVRSRASRAKSTTSSRGVWPSCIGALPSS